MPGVHFAPFDDLEAADKLIAEVQPCGVIVEAVQGEGGIISGRRMPLCRGCGRRVTSMARC